MKRVWCLWTFEESIWTEWMRERYINGRSLNEIDRRSNIDSTLWAGIIDNRRKFNNILICDSNYVCHWVGTSTEFSFKNVVESIRARKDQDNYTKGV